MTEELKEQTKWLKEKCPKCVESLYAYWDTPASDYPECGTWSVECNNEKCDYRYNDSFPTLKWLSEKFNIYLNEDK